MRRIYFILIISSFSFCASQLASAQTYNAEKFLSADELDLLAQEMFDSKDVIDQASAPLLWARAAMLYAEEYEYLPAAESWDNAGLAHLALDDTEQALAAFGAAILNRRKKAINSDFSYLIDPFADFAMLANNSPILAPTMGMYEEVSYINKVRKIVADTPAGEEVANDINSIGEATKALESIMLKSNTSMVILADTPGVQVSFRHWEFKDNDNAPWNQVYADTTVSVRRAAYQIRYRIPSADRDTTIMVRCANGCIQQITAQN